MRVAGEVKEGEKVVDMFAGVRPFSILIAPIKGKGIHTALVRIGKHGEKYLVIIPKRDPVSKSTLISIIKQFGMTREEFIKLLE